MIRYTTPTLKFKLPFEANYLTAAFITLSQRNSCIEKSIDECTLAGKEISCKLTQEDTGKLVISEYAYVQLRCKGKDGKAYASKKFKVEIEDVLKAGAI